MSNISILDCTLRDGGYINNWEFGQDSIKQILRSLCESNVEIIECGFLRDEDYNVNRSVFSSVEQIAEMIQPKKESAMYVAMIALGDIDVNKISERTENSIDGIRLTFHKHQWNEAKESAKILMEKGYKVFVQPVGTTSYSDMELLKLVLDVNILKPFAFYLVDTLGIMYRKDLQRSFFLIDNNLDSEISVGFHSHNNLQLSFANAQELMRFHTKRKIIIDASVYGMGRGVGNLSSELLTQYINVNVEERYSILPLLKIADEYLIEIYNKHRWGYSLPYFLSGIEKCHPNYASYLMEKETLSIESISKVLSLLPVDKRNLFDKNLIEELYLEYQKSDIDDNDVVKELKEICENKTVLLLASGKSILQKVDEIKTVIKNEKAVVFAINFSPDFLKSDYVFVTNQKRLSNLKNVNSAKVIASSNLKNEEFNFDYIINYSSYLGIGSGSDNAGAMLIRLLSKINVGMLYLAGFDGFNPNTAENYCVQNNSAILESETAAQKNQSISNQLKNALNKVSYKLLTPTRYEI